MMHLKIRILFVFILALIMLVKEDVVGGTRVLAQGQDQNVLEKNVQSMKEQITNLENKVKVLETVTTSPVFTILERIAIHTDTIWFLLVLLIVIAVAAIIILALVSLWLIPHSISNLTTSLTSNFGQASTLNTVATRLQEVATGLGTPLNSVAGQIHEVVDKLSRISSFPNVANQLPVIATNLNTLTTVANQLQVIANNLNNFANTLDTKSTLTIVGTQLQKIATKLEASTKF